MIFWPTLWHHIPYLSNKVPSILWFIYYLGKTTMNLLDVEPNDDAFPSFDLNTYLLENEYFLSICLNKILGI